MKRVLTALMACLFGGGFTQELAGTEEAFNKLEPIREITVGESGFVVNGKPFFPLMSWCQSMQTLPLLRSLGFNVFAGNWNNTPDALTMSVEAQKAGGYAIPHYNPVGGEANPYIFLVGWCKMSPICLNRNLTFKLRLILK